MEVVTSDLQGDGEEPIFTSPKTPTGRSTLKAIKGAGPQTHVDISFRDLSASVSTSRTSKKVLLDKVSGFIGSGEMLMVLGSSGCGKSTLLRTIANIRPANVTVQGDILFNSRRLRPSDRRQILSFVAQEAPLLGEFTVHETLWFAARLYFGYGVIDKSVIQAKINDIINALALESCRDVLVGNLFFRGLSGGQRKRLSIAVELISSPACLILDEPTSGLDSYSAITLVKALRDLTTIGHTVIASIHQPGSRIWSLFSNVMLMSQGRCVYFGSAERSVSYFADLGLKCPDYFNPADFFSAVLSTDFASDAFHSKTPQELADIFDASATKRLELGSKLDNIDQGRQTLVGSSGPSTGHALKHRLHFGSKTKFDPLSDTTVASEVKAGRFHSSTSMKQAGFLSATFTLTYRHLKSLYRDPGLLLARVAAYLVLGIVLGLTYLDVGRSYDTEAMLARPSILLAVVGFFSFLSVSAIPFVMDNRLVMDRERKNGAYPLLSYVCADAMSLIPATALLSVIASLFVVFMCSLNNFGAFFFTLFILLYCVETMVHAVACIFKRMETAVAVGIGLFGVVFMCAGFFVPVAEMSWAIRWVSYISFPRYAFRAFMRNELESINATTSAQFPNGEALLNFFAINDDQLTMVWQYWIVISCISLSYIATIYLSIRQMR